MLCLPGMPEVLRDGWTTGLPDSLASLPAGVRWVLLCVLAVVEVGLAVVDHKFPPMGRYR
ncbi:MAG: hypothetical protein FJ086_07530 [Deltaproteobacteria bacterium]|nr:hypothetical protein [Deltaproteobacteria bacterium]